MVLFLAGIRCRADLWLFIGINYRKKCIDTSTRNLKDETKKLIEKVKLGRDLENL
jgi:hypothetical protein